MTTTSATSWPAATSARSGGTATAGVPRKTSRRGVAGASAGTTRPGRYRPGRCSGNASISWTVRRRSSFMASLRWLVVEVLEQEHAVEVVELVLEQPGEQLVGLDRDLVAVEVEPDEVDLLRAARSRRTGPGTDRQPSS